ncbi:hypothetical protein EVAR_27996_1 [Eumeta japonica]|uniref:Uncharacterized protein n=1 Tax=Eumeta variegata TaxID=151549 RepID=A0A4C1WCI4_EUMVA|nr:hypothetical protein EVAR_27996_1 [Eumeta japonica]
MASFKGQKIKVNPGSVSKSGTANGSGIEKENRIGIEIKLRAGPGLPKVESGIEIGSTTGDGIMVDPASSVDTKVVRVHTVHSRPEPWAKVFTLGKDELEAVNDRCHQCDVTSDVFDRSTCSSRHETSTFVGPQLNAH